MTATVLEKPWDFSQVLELVNSLQPGGAEAARLEADSNRKEPEVSTAGGFEARSLGLGDFSRVFHYLGTPVSEKTSAFDIYTPPVNESAPPAFATRDEYASDGATYSKTIPESSMTVQPEGQTSNEDPATADAVSDSSVLPDTPTLSKAQRKKRNKKERREKQAALAAQRAAKKSISESEAEVATKTPARKASAHALPTTPTSRYNLRQRDGSGKAIIAIPHESFEDAVSLAVQKVNSVKKTTPSDATPAIADVTAQVHIAPDIPLASWSKFASDVSNQSVQQGGTPKAKHSTNRLVPSSVQPRSNSAAKRSSVQNHTTTNQLLSTPKSPSTIEPIIIRSGEDRHWALLMKLLRDFYEDRRHLVAPMNLTTHNNDPKGIHVFVDASNIFIGFNEQLKLARGIHPMQQIPAVDLSFDALALLIERRRPVAKRVLVGSTPHLAAFDKAKAVGYECSILEKVYKARELTERQIYFKEVDRQIRNRRKAPPVNNVATVNGGGNGSGSETNTPQYAPARMIEQGVDEILHLKILESVVDADEPGTIVLATGDAAQAEYSEGFMAMAERALKKGWTVELVSWSKNISQMYTKPAWRKAWGERFRIILIDDYAEELLDM